MNEENESVIVGPATAAHSTVRVPSGDVTALGNDGWKSVCGCNDAAYGRVENARRIAALWNLAFRQGLTTEQIENAACIQLGFVVSEPTS